MIEYKIHPILTCDWTSVAGTVTNLKGRAVRGYYVQVTRPDRTVQSVITGSSPDYDFASGWEVRLGGRQIKGTWQVQLFADAALKKPLSQAYAITMPGRCQANLAFVRFQQNH
jgi:hypothetical protein